MRARAGEAARAPEPRLEGRRQESLRASVVRCEAWYGARERPCIFRLSPFSDPALDDLLDRRGYALVDRTAVLQRSTAPLPAPAGGRKTVSTAGSAGTRIDGADLDEWLACHAGMSGRGPAASPELARAIRGLPGERLLALLRPAPGAGPVACGLATLDRDLVGLYDLVTHAAHRRRGHATDLVAGLLSWGARHGARTAYLQVARANLPAWRLYQKLGFAWVYDFWYRERR